MSEDFVDAEVINYALNKDILETIQWRTKEGEYIFVRDMEDKHLRNAALFLMGLGYQKCSTPDNIRAAWLSVFRLEWERRMNNPHRIRKIYGPLINRRLIQ